MRLAGDWAPKDRQVDALPWSGGPLLLNLEGPVLPSLTGYVPSPKAGPHLAHMSLPKTAASVVFVLANNHVMDYGPGGLAETLRQIEQAGFRSLGAGHNAGDATRSSIVEWDGIRIGILARCEVQFGTATHQSPGVSALDATVYRAIRDLKAECDAVIASIHAAAEMCPWPSPRRQDAWRALVDAGADVVHGHHAHVPQGWESYADGFIFYGLGNLCVDPVAWSKHPNALWSLAPELSWESGKLHAPPRHGGDPGIG